MRAHGWLACRCADLPEAWNAAIKRDLGLEVPNDAQGVLQDVHWSTGYIGSFPTYTIGNVMARAGDGDAAPARTRPSMRRSRPANMPPRRRSAGTDLAAWPPLHARRAARSARPAAASIRHLTSPICAASTPPDAAVQVDEPSRSGFRSALLNGRLVRPYGRRANRRRPDAPRLEPSIPCAGVSSGIGSFSARSRPR